VPELPSQYGDGSGRIVATLPLGAGSTPAMSDGTAFPLAVFREPSPLARRIAAGADPPCVTFWPHSARSSRSGATALMVMASGRGQVLL